MMRKELRIGLCLFGVFLLLNVFDETPELLLGMLFGFALCFEMIGILPDRAYQKLKSWKRRLKGTSRP